MNKVVTNKIAVHRALLGLSQKELATAIGISRKTISTIETSLCTPSVQIALSIAAYFNVPVEVLFQLEQAS